jgi:hypothetical protein
MDPTMRQLIKDVVLLRKATGVTQQEVSAMAGEPCRTFLAHFEQGRKTHVNLEKFYRVLHVFFNKAKGIPVSDTYVTVAQFDLAIASLRAEILASKGVITPKVQRTVVEKPTKPQFEQYVDEIVCRYTVDSPVDTQVLLGILKARVDAGEIQLYSSNRLLKIQESKFIRTKGTKLRCSAISLYLQTSGKEFTGLNTPDKFPQVKFIRLSPAVNAPNPHYAWPKILSAPPAPVPAQLTLLAPPRNQILTGLTQEETDYAMANFGHGPKNDAGWVYFAHPVLWRQLAELGRTTKEAVHRVTHRNIESAETTMPGVRTPTKQSHELVSAYLLWLYSLGHIHVDKQGSDLIVTRASGRTYAVVDVLPAARQA